MPGFHRLGDYTKYITCGNIRKCKNGVSSQCLDYILLRSDLHTRKETRETAWKLEGWSETVSKVRIVFVCLCGDGLILMRRGFPRLRTFRSSWIRIFLKRYPTAR